MNYVAIFITSIAAVAIGFLWYSPVMFGAIWQKLHGYTDESLAEKQKTAMKGYVVSVFATIVEMYILAVVLGLSDLVGFFGGMLLGCWIWLGFVFTIGLSAAIFDEKPLKLFLIDAFYQFFILALAGGVLNIWK